MSMVSKRMQWAVEYGHTTLMSHATGVPEQRYDAIDLADWDKYELLKDLFRQKPEHADFTNSIFQCVLFSSNIPPTGRGKSNTMYTLAEVSQSVFPGIRILSNNTSDPFETVPEQWADLEAIIKEDSSQWKLLLIDEAAQFLQYADQGAGKSISQRLKLLRHNRCHLIMVGHTGRDIPADIRRQVFVCDKLSKKTASFGYGIQPKKGDDRMQVAEELFRVENIPATNIDYDDIDDEGIEIKFDKESAEVDESEGTEEDYHQCEARTKTDEQCRKEARYPRADPTYCGTHRSKLKDDESD
jgi:hypothetical protein